MIRDHIRPHIRSHIRGFVGLSPPVNVTATVSGSDIVITWTAASSVDGYNIYQSIDGGTWTKLNATPETGVSYTLTPTDPGEYNFYVTSVRGDKESAASAETTTTESMMTQVYTATLSPRISAVDGTAFVDNTAAITTYADGNHLLEIEDSSGNVASGVLKARGVGETLGSELVDQWTNDGFDTFSTTGTDINTATAVGFARFVAVTALPYAINSGLYKLEIDSVTDVGDKVFAFGFGTSDTLNTSERYNFTSGMQYKTNGTGFVCTRFVGRTLENSDISMTGFSFKQVTAPSTSGCTLVDEISGTTQNFFTVPAGFIYNEASYTCRVKKILPTA